MVDINDLIANHEKDEKEERILKSDVEQILFEKYIMAATDCILIKMWQN